MKHGWKRRHSARQRTELRNTRTSLQCVPVVDVGIFFKLSRQLSVGGQVITHNDYLKRPLISTVLFQKKVFQHTMASYDLVIVGAGTSFCKSSNEPIEWTDSSEVSMHS